MSKLKQMLANGSTGKVLRRQAVGSECSNPEHMQNATGLVSLIWNFIPGELKSDRSQELIGYQV